MAKVIINIPDDEYNYFMYSEDFDSDDGYDAIEYICNGTVLPKGHGRLIDVGQCDRELFYQQCGGENSLITVKSAFDMLMSLPPIIEADKSESEDKE